VNLVTTALAGWLAALAPLGGTAARAASAVSPAAPTATVLLLRPAHPAAAAAEAMVRLRGELMAAGFAVQVADVAASADPRAAVDRAIARTRAEAVIAILGDPAYQPAELRVVDRATGKTIGRQVPVPDESSRAAEIFSIRALELLRASLLEVALPPGDAKVRATPPEAGGPSGSAKAPAEAAKRSESARPAGNAGATTGEQPRAEPRPRDPREQPSPEAESPPSTRTPVVTTRRANVTSGESRPPATPRSRYAVELGAVVLGSFEGLPPSVLPVIRGAVRLSPHFQARLSLAGLGTRAHLQAAGGAGEETVAQSFGLVEVALDLRPGARVQPFLSLGAGAAHLAVEGRASWPYESKAGGLWAAVADAGLGVRVGLGQRFQLAAEVHAQGAYPYPVVRFLDMTLAEAGRPTVLGGLSVIARL